MHPRNLTLTFLGMFWVFVLAAIIAAHYGFRILPAILAIAAALTFPAYGWILNHTNTGEQEHV